MSGRSDERRPAWLPQPGRARRSTSGSLVTLGLLLLVGLIVPGANASAVAPFASHPNAYGVAVAVASLGHAAPPPTFGAPPPPAPVRGTVRGSFFSTTTIPNAPSTSQVAYYGTKVNVSNDPSMNLTSNGVLALAYTTYTTKAPCAGMVTSARSEVGFVASTDGGRTWTAPQYLGNPVCTGADRNYSSAWEPTLTSLANGTLVLAYVEFNVSTSGFAYLPDAYFGPSNSSYGYNIPYDRLVVTESYNGGSSWTTPAVVNSSVNKGPNYLRAWAPQRPSMTAAGSTVYLAWENATQAPGADNSVYPPKGVGSMQVHVVVSSNGGGAWGPVRNLPVWRGNGPSIGFNPSIALGPGGQILVAYTTNVSYRYPWTFAGGYSVYGLLTGDVVLANSSNNGTTFAVHLVAADVPMWAQWGVFYSPSPEVAYSPLFHQVVVAFSGQTFLQVCTAYCTAIQVYPTYVANSSTLGSSWSAYHPALPALDLYGSHYYYVTNPTIAFDSAGLLHLLVSFVNTSVCQSGNYGSTCGPETELAAASSDFGATFGSPLLFTDNATPWGGFGNRDPTGEYASMVTGGKSTIYAWVENLCSSWKSSLCSWPSGGTGTAHVEVSIPFKGTGSTLTFVEKGLVAGTHWAASVMGNVVAAVAPASLAVSGIPASQGVLWNITRTDAGYGYAFSGKANAKSPVTLAKNLTVDENYTELILLNLATAPSLVNWTSSYSYCSTGAGYHWDYPTCSEVNYNVTPKPSSRWVTPGTAFSLKVTPAPIYCIGTCYESNELNLTFDSISGSGIGAVSTTGMSVAGVARHPINETASFTLNGWCYIVYAAGGNTTWCFPAQGAVTFAETGLPRGLAWAASVWSPNGRNFTTNRSTTPYLSIAGNGTAGVIDFAAWSIPAGGGKFWIPKSTPASPVQLPGQSFVQVAYTLGSPENQSFGLNVNETGLPNGTAWSVALDRTMYGERSPVASFAASGGTHAINASRAYLPDGTGFTPGSIVVIPLVANESPFRVARLPYGALALNGTTFVTVEYAPIFWVAVDASTGGTVSPASLWVGAGASQSFTATANAGYSFVGWSGAGQGSATSTATTITVKPFGPIEESATFVRNPPPTFNVSVNPIGLPAGVGYSVGLGGTDYGGVGQFTIAGVASGTYALTLPFAYLNATDRTRFVPTLGSTTFSRSPSGALEISGDGSIVLDFATQYLLTIGATGNGTVAPAPGSYWTNAGATVPLTATPQFHYRLAAWNGSGNGSVNTRTATVDLRVAGPIWETAQFVWAPRLPAGSFELTVREAGLPANVAWNVTVGTMGASARGGSLVVGGLNGSYTVEVPPVLVAPGVQFVASGNGTVPATVTSNTTVFVNFTEQFALRVTPSWGGSSTVNGTTWLPPGTVVTLVATAQAGARFVGWSGNGSGAVNTTAPSVTVTLSGPVTETAMFAPIYSAPKPASAWAGAPLGLGLLAGLAAVGVGAGVALGRRRRTSPAPAPAWTEEGPGPETEGLPEVPTETAFEPPVEPAYEPDAPPGPDQE